MYAVLWKYSVHIRLNSEFWASKCEAVFALATFYNSSAQFLNLRGVPTLVSCPILVNLQVYFSMLESFARGLTFVFFHRCWCSGRWLLWNYKDDKKYSLFPNSNTIPPEYDLKKCKRSTYFHWEFSLYCSKGKAFCEGPFALHRSQREKG